MYTYLYCVIFLNIWVILAFFRMLLKKKMDMYCILNFKSMFFLRFSSDFMQVGNTQPQNEIFYASEVMRLRKMVLNKNDVWEW